MIYDCILLLLLLPWYNAFFLILSRHDYIIMIDVSLSGGKGGREGREWCEQRERQ